MTDRELLELAAKAFWTNTDVSFCFDENENAIVFNDADNQDHNGQDRELVWSPLTDDGDAFRLAVKLQLDVCTSVCRIGVNGWYSDEADTIGMEAATRLAIVRAAAEIGAQD